VVRVQKPTPDIRMAPIRQHLFGRAYQASNLRDQTAFDEYEADEQQAFDALRGGYAKEAKNQASFADVQRRAQSFVERVVRGATDAPSGGP